MSVFFKKLWIIMMNWLEELEKTKSQIEKELERVNGQIYQANLRKHGLSIGCIVTRNGEEFKVTRAEFQFDKPWVCGVRKNKKGELVTREIVLFEEWELK